MDWFKRLRPDNYVLAILGMVVLASLLPIHGVAAKDFGLFTKVVIALLFFLHGARLSREAVIAGLVNWRLHLVVLASTFVLFPVLGLMLQQLPAAVMPSALSAGVLFLCCLPSTVQSSIAFTSVARGDVAAAVCAASASNLFGIFITPVVAGLTLQAHGAGFSMSAVEAIVIQLLAPFLAGQLLRPLIGDWIKRHAKLVGYVDRGSILLVVYGAFSDAVVGGIWHKVTPLQIVILALVCCALLAAVLAITAYGSRALGFSKEEEITIVFCGSKKSLASGVPMAGILFPAANVGLMVLPLMLFHQIQLMACAVIAQRYAARSAPVPEPVLA
ncbi:MAG TPA: bile acid:sodium symporter family protein [Caulobacteraceae bacterium]|nr:bile acid:sodium symporter family protein [Caulobacteraceae bacterium]